MELGSAPRCGPRALPATSPSGPGPRCTRGKPVLLSNALMDAPRAGEGAKRSSSFLSASFFDSQRSLLCPPSPSSSSVASLSDCVSPPGWL